MFSRNTVLVCIGITLCLGLLVGCENPKYVFLTDGDYNGNLGGFWGAAEICQAEADAAGLPGEYLPWLGTASTCNEFGAYPDCAFTKDGMPYRRVDLVAVASDWADLTDGSLLSPINVTATGQVRDEGYLAVWSNVLADGTRKSNYLPDYCGQYFHDGPDYASWMGWYGPLDPPDEDYYWTDAPIIWACSMLAPLYCFQQ